jgi:glucose/arabinose dehydrogenase
MSLVRVVVALIAVGLTSVACTDDNASIITAAVTSAPSAPATTPVPASTTSTAAPSATTATIGSVTTEPLPPLLGIAARTIAGDLDRPVFVTGIQGTDRLLVLQQGGSIVAVDPESGQIEPFLDISDRVGDFGIEQGLLGLALHPGFADNGRLFAYYTDLEENSRLVEFSGGESSADPASERLILTVEQPTDRHNAGMIEFGPDGYLYVALGDGGDGGSNGQDVDSLLGTILRIDVDGADPYVVPPDNPFADGGGAPEIWAYGLRNPWRFSIDTTDGLLYIGDVGRETWEEIDVIPVDVEGANLGWRIMEGSACFATSSCDEAGLVLPAVEYGHDEGCSVTGGYVYRGSALPELNGHYFYADWCQGWVRSFRFTAEGVADAHDWMEDLGRLGQVTSFGVDGVGELYLTTSEGGLFRLDPLR